MLTFLKKKPYVLSACRIALLKLDELHPDLFSRCQTNRISIKLITVYGKNIEEMIDYVKIFNESVKQEQRVKNSVIVEYPEKIVMVGHFFRCKKGNLINSVKYAEILLTELRKALEFYHRIENSKTRTRIEEFYNKHVQGSKMLFINLVEDLNDTFQR